MTTELVVYDKNGHRVTVQRTSRPVYRLKTVQPGGKPVYKYLPSVREAARRAAWKMVEATYPVYDRDAEVDIGDEDGPVNCECGTAYDSSQLGSYHCPLHSTVGGFYRRERDRLAAELLKSLQTMQEQPVCASCGDVLDDPFVRPYMGTAHGALICLDCVRSLYWWLTQYTTAQEAGKKGAQDAGT